jgi:hypothetical protein
VLVVGHADTVPLIIQRLGERLGGERAGGGSVPAFSDSEYDRLTVLVSGARGKATMLTLRYGR